MGVSDKEVVELVRNGWLPINGEKALFINEKLFKKGIIALVDPSNYHPSKIEDNGPFSVSKERRVVFLNDDKSCKKAKHFFNLPVTTVSLLNAKRREECYVPVIVLNEQGQVVSGLYIHPRKVGQNDAEIGAISFTAFHDAYSDERERRFC